MKINQSMFSILPASYIRFEPVCPATFTATIPVCLPRSHQGIVCLVFYVFAAFSLCLHRCIFCDRPEVVREGCLKWLVPRLWISSYRPLVGWFFSVLSLMFSTLLCTSRQPKSVSHTEVGNGLTSRVIIFSCVSRHWYWAEFLIAFGQRCWPCLLLMWRVP